MSRITKEIAHATAVSLLSDKKENIKKLKEQLREMVTSAVKKTIPHEVMEMYKKHPDYFNTHTNTRFNCAGFAYEYYNFNELPDNGDNPTIGTQEGNKILALSNKVADAESKYNSLRNEIEIALFAFRTYANVEKEFPEAFALLPEKMSQTVMINISSLRSQIAL
jgi:hypothetical protein